MSYKGIESIPIVRRRKIISGLSEAKIWPLLASILQKMGFNWVDITHGTDEHGRDLVGSAKTITGGSEYVGFIVKAEPISGGVSGKTTFIKVLDQIKLAFSAKYTGPYTRNPEKINRVVVVTNHTISSTAKQEISTSDYPYGSIEFWQINDLEKYVTAFLPSFYLNIEPELYTYLIALRSKCENVQDIQRRIHYIEDKKLTDIFVNLPIVEVKRGKRIPLPGKMEKKKDKKKVFGEFEEIKFISNDELLTPKKDYILVGGPGAGKSCLLRRICINLIEKRLSGDDTQPLPLYLNAKDLAEEKDVILTIVLNKIFCSDEFKKSVVGGNAELAKDHNFTLLVDGLDEVPSDKKRSSIYDALLQLSSEYLNIKLVLSSRPLHMWKEGPNGDIQEGAILPIQRSAMADLLQKLISGPQKSTAILREIVQNEVFHKLPRTPLVVTLIALLHEENELPEIPANLSDLYELFCMVYLERWTKSGQKRYDSKIAIIELFAFHLHNERKTESKVFDFFTITKNYLLKKGIEGDPHQFTTELIKENLLLICKVPNNGIQDLDCLLHKGKSICSVDCNIGFIHLSFQEFFVARHLKRRPNDGENILAENFDDPWWGSLGLFFSGFVKDVANLIKTITSTKPLGGPLSIARMVNLGHLSQAATQTDFDVKKQSCLHGASLIEDGYRYLIELNKVHNINTPKYQLVGALCWLYEQAYSSVHLETSLKECFNSLLQSLDKTDKLTEQRETLGLQVLGIAWALANTGEIDPLLELSNVIDQSDGALTAMMTMVLESFEDQLLKENGMPVNTVERKQRWLKAIKGIKKRAKRHKDLLIEDMNKVVKEIDFKEE